MTLVSYRPPDPSDLQFVTDSWIKSTRNSDFCTFIPNTIYYRYMDNLIKSIISRSLVTIICDPEDPTHVFGYVVYEYIGEIFVLHFGYVKQSYRNLKIMYNALKAVNPSFGDDESFITHIDRTHAKALLDRVTKEPIVKRSSWFIRNREKYKLNYNPFLLVR